MSSIYSLRKFLQTRDCHAYCVGAAKTGTTSLSQVFSSVLRSAHEPETVSTIDLVISYLKGEMKEANVKRALKNRDMRLFLEFEASHPLGYLTPQLTELFPEAKFIITYRTPLEWLKSRINFHYHKQPTEWERYRNFIWGRHFNRYSKFEAALEERGLFSVDAYLKQYFEQYEILLNTIPKERRMIIKTEHINESLIQSADFLGLKTEKLDAVWTNKLKTDNSIFEMISKEFVVDSIAKLDQISARIEQELSDSNNTRN